MTASEPFRRKAVRGLYDPALEDALIERALTCLTTGDPGPGATVLKAERVWRLGGYVLKRYPAREGLARWRPTPAIREARAARRIAPLRTPTPRLAVVGPERASVLVTDHVDGVPLGDAWSEPAARATLPAFVAEQHERGVFHGDPHPANQLWDGECWWLIDLDGLRSVLRCLRPGELAVRHWARLWHNLEVGGRRPEPEIRTSLRTYAVRRGLGPEAFVKAVEAQLGTLSRTS